MPESIEEVHAGARRSWTPLLMTLAFAIGAGVTGWIVFHEEIKEWARIEDMAWQPSGGERLTLVQHDRLRRIVTGEADGIVSTDTEWLIIPAARGRVPGQPLGWTQTLHGGTWELRSGDVVQLSGVTPDPAAVPEEPRPHPKKDEEPAPKLPGDAAVLAYLPALDLGANIDAAGSAVVAAPSLEALEQIETRRTGKAVEKRKPLEAPQIDALNADLGIVSQRVGFDLAACAPGDYYRPGQTWTREAALPIGEWGVHVVRLELEHQGYEGDVALVAGTLSRKPVEGALTSEDGLSGLKGEIECRYDVAARRMDAGHYTIEARGKSSRKFATLGIDHAFALAGPGETAAIPAALDVAALPPPVVPTEPPPPQPPPPQPPPPRPPPSQPAPAEPPPPPPAPAEPPPPPPAPPEPPPPQPP